MPLDTALLEQSFARVRPDAARFANTFYARLFEAHPEVRPLFAGVDMAAQERKLMDSLVLVVENLENPDVLTSALQRLGAKHASWRVTPAHYAAVGGALLDTFAEFLRDAWTPAVRQAWVDAYGAIVSIMSGPVTPTAR
jgi:nitric oxide dioxygenase